MGTTLGPSGYNSADQQTGVARMDRERGRRDGDTPTQAALPAPAQPKAVPDLTPGKGSDRDSAGNPSNPFDS